VWPVDIVMHEEAGVGTNSCKDHKKDEKFLQKTSGAKCATYSGYKKIWKNEFLKQLSVRGGGVVVSAFTLCHLCPESLK